MRECHGLVDALVTYINHALDVGKCEDKVRVAGGEGRPEQRGWRAPACSDCSLLPKERGERRVCAEELVLPAV